MLLTRFMNKCLYGHMLSFLLGNIPGVELLCHMETLCFLSFWKTAKLVLKWLYHFAFPLAVYGGFTFSIFSSVLVIICLLNYSHSSVCGMAHTMCVKSHCFDLHFSGGKYVERIFRCLLTVYLFSRNVYSDTFAHFSNWLFLILRCKCSLYILDTSSLIGT